VAKWSYLHFLYFPTDHRGSSELNGSSGLAGPDFIPEFDFKKSALLIRCRPSPSWKVCGSCRCRTAGVTLEVAPEVAPEDIAEVTVGVTAEDMESGSVAGFTSAVGVVFPVNKGSGSW